MERDASIWGRDEKGEPGHLAKSAALGSPSGDLPARNIGLAPWIRHLKV